MRRVSGVSSREGTHSRVRTNNQQGQTEQEGWHQYQEETLQVSGCGTGDTLPGMPVKAPNEARVAELTHTLSPERARGVCLLLTVT